MGIYENMIHSTRTRRKLHSQAESYRYNGEREQLPLGDLLGRPHPPFSMVGIEHRLCRQLGTKSVRVK